MLVGHLKTETNCLLFATCSKSDCANVEQISIGSDQGDEDAPNSGKPPETVIKVRRAGRRLGPDAVIGAD